jgi:hypothetical protein
MALAEFEILTSMSGVHLSIRVIRRRIPCHRHFVAKLSGKANGRFDAGMRYGPDNDELMGAVLLELKIQICVGEAARTPMLIRRLKLAVRPEGANHQ